MSNAPQYSVWVNACDQIWQTKNNPTHLDVHVINPPFVEHRRRFLSILPEPHGSEEHLRRVLLLFQHTVVRRQIILLYEILFVWFRVQIAVHRFRPTEP